MLSEITSIDQSNLRNQLELLGLDEEEARAYLALVELGQGSVLDIARRAVIKRPTAYAVLGRLVKQGLVSETRFRDVLDYRLRPLGALKRLVRHQSRLIDRELPELRRLYAHRTRKLRIRSYSSLDGVKTLFEKVLREKSDLCVFGSERSFTRTLGNYFAFFQKRAAQQGISIQTKQYPGTTQLLFWSDKVAFVEFGPTTQAIAFKSKPLHEWYKKLWNNY